MVSIGQTVAVLAQGFPVSLYARCCPQSLREDEPQIPREIPRGNLNRAVRNG